MPFTFTPAGLPGVVVIEAEIFGDRRGFFMETYRRSAFEAAGITVTFVQTNQSRSMQGTLRGLHAQRPPRAQGKLVRVLRGEIFDVAADVRPGSPTFGRWDGIILSSDNRRSVYIPPGYVHGFCVLSPDADVVYQTTEEYAPELEFGVRWDDPRLGIRWPMTSPTLSERDRCWPLLGETGDPAGGPRL
ncbi:MAG TPA: dTDP-4-dehydrorhamnose 3,5-epimerase [Vicinamibacterales bacterium]|nr:dTDP-4-dehydrorhamnose 3,5-epimerase [Vicinamibacterales bacterium]